MVCRPPAAISATLSPFEVKNFNVAGGLDDKLVYLPSYPWLLDPHEKHVPVDSSIAIVWIRPHATLVILNLARHSINLGVLKNGLYSPASFFISNGDILPTSPISRFCWLYSPSFPNWLLPIEYSNPLAVSKNAKSSPQATS